MKICTVKECERKGITRGWCSRHYMLWYRTGNPIGYKRSQKSNNSKLPEYIVWASMKQRCMYRNSISYKNYGGRGIKICDRWLGIDGFSRFMADMGQRPRGTSLDRINNDGNYEPSNCRWATRKQQAVNKRTYVNNTSGQTGVYKHKDKWQAHIRRNRKTLYLGIFNSKKEAIRVRQHAEDQYYAQ